MVEYRVANDRDMDEIIDLINMVFSMLRIPHDFPVLLPKVYAPKTRISDIHVIAREEGKLCGVFGLLPFAQKLADETISCGYLGSMAVHPRARGKGVMGEMCRLQIERGREMGLDLLALGGQRQRYEHSGFAACGSRMRYTVTKANIRHMKHDPRAQQIAFRVLEKNSADADYAFELYEKQIVTGARTRENFVSALQTYWNTPWLICCGGEPAGYMMASGDGRDVLELVLEDESLLPAVLEAWFGQRNVSSISLVTGQHEQARCAFLSRAAEGMSMASDEMFLCLKPERVIRACMRLKQTYMKLEDGVFRLGFGGYGTLRISVRAGAVSVERTQEAPDLALDEQDAHSFVFGFDRARWLASDAGTPRGWFPMQLHIQEADRF
ncbi:MAG: GNAT family N-acetyltransferase [Clostridia bacterium]|nr:GNAT family N-acetyltransferase [Clostridia bacterium]